MINENEGNDKALSPEDAKLLVKFFTILAEWDAQAKKDEPDINLLKENRSACASRPTLEASLNFADAP